MNVILVTIYGLMAIAFVGAAAWCGCKWWQERHGAGFERVSYLAPIGILLVFAHLWLFTIAALL